MNYNNLSLDTALSREFSKMGMTVINIELNLSTVTGKHIYILKKISVSNKFCSFELSIHQRILKKVLRVSQFL